MKLAPEQIVLRPRITEKSVFLQNMRNTYVFQVHPKATKTQIREAIGNIFGVKVDNVCTSTRRGKQRRTKHGVGFTPDWKQAFVTVADGQKIEGV